MRFAKEIFWFITVKSIFNATGSTFHRKSHCPKISHFWKNLIIKISKEIYKSPIHITSCGHSFCLQCIRPLADQSEEWNCPLCQTQQTVSPQQLSRNYTLEQVLQSLSLNDQQDKIDRAQHKLNIIVEAIISEITDQQSRINELIEKQPDQFTRNILRSDFLFQLRKFFLSTAFYISFL